MTVREQIGYLRAPSDNTKQLFKDCCAAADTMEKLLAVYKWAEKCLPYINGHYGFRQKLIEAIAAVEALDEK